MSQSLDRALTILGLTADGPKTITELSQALDVHSTTALRLVHSLKKHRYLRPVGDGSYGLGPALIELGQRALETSDIRSIARPYLRALNEKTTETVHMAMLEGLDITYVDKVEGSHAVRIESRVGRVVLKHCTGVGKAILSYLGEPDLEKHISTIDFHRFTPTTITEPDAFRQELELTRQRGYAVDDEEHEPGICCVAVPVFAASGAVAGSVSVSAPTSRLPLPSLLKFLPDIEYAAGEISAGLGFSGVKRQENVG